MPRGSTRSPSFQPASFQGRALHSAAFLVARADANHGVNGIVVLSQALTLHPLAFGTRVAESLQMAALNLSAVETRVLGCLLEKERVTPENYPLSLHRLTAACNQLTNREPITGYDEKAIEAGVNALREKKVATAVFGAGSRVQKYRHNLLSHYELAPAEVALLTVLLLRGPQTPGELRARTERMYAFSSLEELEGRLEELGRGETPLIRLLPPRPGQKERRYIQLFTDEAVLDELPIGVPGEIAREPQPLVASSGRMQAVEEELAALRRELSAVREELAAFRKQFE